jgi:hypothetical protein
MADCGSRALGDYRTWLLELQLVCWITRRQVLVRANVGSGMRQLCGIRQCGCGRYAFSIGAASRLWLVTADGRGPLMLAANVFLKINCLEGFINPILGLDDDSVTCPMQVFKAHSLRSKYDKTLCSRISSISRFDLWPACVYRISWVRLGNTRRLMGIDTSIPEYAPRTCMLLQDKVLTNQPRVTCENLVPLDCSAQQT